MYNYSLFQWMMFFFVYCFFGWCIESTIVSISKRRLVNRGFLRIPMLPLYGFGAILILFLTIPFKALPWMVYLTGMIGATILEYLTGWLMEALFKMKYWDYSNNKIQLHGRICLSSSLFWGVLSVLLTECIHPPIEAWVLGMNPLFARISVCLIFCIMLVDTIISAKAALDLVKVLEHLSAVREEIEHLRSQLDELKESTQLQLENLRESTELIQTQLRERKEQLKTRLIELSELHESEISHLGFLKSQLLKGHPTAYSKKFNAALRELKEHLYSRKG